MRFESDDEKENLADHYVGRVFVIWHCRGALKSYYNALESVEANKRGKFTRSLIYQIERLANGEKISPIHFPKEDKLPARSDGESFYALKRIPLRGYCWLSQRHSNTYFISHYINKRKDKLDRNDTKKVHNNWYRIEEGDDEC